MNIRKLALTGALAALLLHTALPATILGHSGLPLPSDSPSPINVVINETPVYLFQQPIIQKDRSLMPLRALVESLGAQVGWEPETRRITVAFGSRQLQMTLDSPLAYVNGREVTLDVLPVVRDGRTFVPVRFVAEALGAQVGWDSRTRTIALNLPEASLQPGTGAMPSLSAADFPGLKVILYGVEEDASQYRLTLGTIFDQTAYKAAGCLGTTGELGPRQSADLPADLYQVIVRKAADGSPATGIACQGTSVAEVHVQPGQESELPIPGWVAERYSGARVTYTMSADGTKLHLATDVSPQLESDGFPFDLATSTLAIGGDDSSIKRTPVERDRYEYQLTTPAPGGIWIRVYSELHYPLLRLERAGSQYALDMVDAGGVLR